MKISMVVLNYNDSQTTIKLLDSIKEYKTIENIVVVDNCSPDGSFDVLKGYCDNYGKGLDVIQSDKNGGYAYGNNFGCNYAIDNYNPDYLVIANPDIFFREEVLKHILDIYEMQKDAAVVSCLMNCMSEIDLPSAWKIPKYRDCILENLLVLRWFVGNRTRYTQKELNQSINKVDVVAGSFFAIKTEAFNKVGGFDDSTFLYYEENILAYKLQQAGYSNYLVMDDSYYHMHSVSIDKSLGSVKRKLDYAYISRKYYMKNYLKCGKNLLIITDVTYRIGLINYLCASKLRSILKGVSRWRKN
jgi:GT2 family glycosyltransferase